MVSSPVSRRTFAGRVLGTGGAAELAAGFGGPPVLSAQRQTGSTPPPAGGHGSLAALLALAPDLPTLPDQSGLQIAQFADCAAQMAAVGVQPPTLGDEESESAWVRATWWMPLPHMMRSFALDDAWPEV